MTRKADYLARSERNATTFDNSFQTLGTSITSPSVILKIINNSDTDIDISIDAGTTEHDFIPSESFVLYDMRGNHGREFDYGFPTGTQFHIRGAAAGVGIVYLVILREIP